MNCPLKVEEREDEFKAAVNIGYGESIKHEFGRLLGKALAKQTGKEAEYRKPDLVVVFNPFLEKVRFKLTLFSLLADTANWFETIPQSKWFCSDCRGRGCEKCGGTGKLYPESVEELSSKAVA